MTIEEIIQGLQFTINMFLSDPLTGEPITKPRNEMDKTTIDACKGAIELLEQQSYYNPDEWCHDCSEYNHDKHCCPRYNKVIRTAVEEMKQEQEPCDKCEVGNPCLYCKHEFEPQESEKINDTH